MKILPFNTYAHLIRDNWQNINLSQEMEASFDAKYLHFLLYNTFPKYMPSLVQNINTEEFILDNEHCDNPTSYKDYDEGLKNISFQDTINKLDDIFRPEEKRAIVVTDIGLVAFSSTSKFKGTTCRKLDFVDIYCNTFEQAKELAEFAKTLLVISKEKKEKPTIKYGWVRKTNYGITTETLDFDDMNVDINKNYNDDLPYNKIINLINSEDKQLILFNGKPGTGKTTFIKHLMKQYNESMPLYIDSSILISIDPTSFISFLLGYKNPLIILEDCEKILSKREKGNPFMGTLLNITDGIIGDTIKPKFICSFNCNESNIDEALLRKGRLTLKYTFNDLSLEKTKELIPSATKPMTLADIYNNDDENIINKEITTNKIGF